uniref:Uncharacterized protein n=1 Tax=Setaria italica TaxID=4555 RepID=K3ZBS9_SETIT
MLFGQFHDVHTDKPVSITRHQNSDLHIVVTFIFCTSISHLNHVRLEEIHRR